MKILKILSTGILAMFIGLNFLFAQESAVYSDTDRDFKKAMELFDKQKYASAQVLFNKVVHEKGNLYSDVKADAAYYAAICALELFNEDAEYLITDFIAKHPESPRIWMANFQMGKYHYRKKNYEEALSWFNRVDKFDLNEEDLAEFHFKVGYSYFALNDFEKATKSFFEIKDGKSQYAAPAMYYYAHIAYDNENYETALNGFLSLEENEIFSSIVPYYIAQIYYLQEKYTKLLAYAPDFVDSASAKRAPEIARLVGEAYYRTEKYTDALPYLEMYKKGATSYSREEIYELAFSYYKSEKYNQAIELFPSITNVGDKLSQHAYFYLADCYLKTEDKKNARLAFFASSKLGFNPEIKELSLLNYAKLTYELSFSQFNETANAFNTFLEEFPDSKYTDQVYNYLVEVYLNAKNYKDALNSIEKIKVKSPEIKRAYQRVSYFRGLELINNLQYAEAIEVLNKSLSAGDYNKTIRAETLYWIGEAYYRLQDYENAIASYKELLVTPGAIVLPVFQSSYYNLGYAYFKLKDYNNSLSWFRKYVDDNDSSRIDDLSDAYIRIGDIYFLDREYNNAIKNYASAVELNSVDYDYALFQKGFTNGLIKNYKDKIDDLQVLIKDTTSAYYDDALYELGKTYFAIDSLQKAIDYYEQVIVKFPNSSYLRKSVLQLGLLYYNIDKNQEALAMYKRVISDYPGSQEAKDALIGLKNIYVDINNVDGYFEYVAGLGDFANVSLSEQDSLSYLSAENQYIEGNFEDAENQFEEYIQRFSTGSFILNAHYYKADCNLKDGETSNAIESLKFIIEKPKNTFTEPALLLLADLYFNNEQYAEAAEQYALLENLTETKINLLTARIGLLRSTFLLKKYEQTIQVANKLFYTEKVSEEIKREARYKLAYSYLNTGKTEQALNEFRILAQDVTNQEGAESKYKVIEILFNTNRYQLAEEEIFSFENTPFQNWLARSFIILSDIYRMNDDLFQARATLESVIQNYNQESDEVMKIANEKLMEIIRLQDEQMPQKVQQEMKIEFNENVDQDYEELFETDEESGELQKETNLEEPDSVNLPLIENMKTDSIAADTIMNVQETESSDSIK